MKKAVGIVTFAVVAAVSYYLHFNKVANTYLTKRVKLGKVQEGRSEAVIDGASCFEASKYEGRFVRVEGTVEKVFKRGKNLVLNLGCLEVVLHVPVSVEPVAGSKVSLRGFVKNDRGRFYIDIWDDTLISLSARP